MTDLYEAREWAEWHRVNDPNHRAAILLDALENAEGAAEGANVAMNHNTRVLLDEIEELKVRCKELESETIKAFDRSHRAISVMVKITAELESVRGERDAAYLAFHALSDEEQPAEKTGPHALDCTARLTTNGFCSCGAVREYPKVGT